MAATVVTFRQQLIQQSTNMPLGSSTSLKLEKNVFITSDITVNARHVDDDNTRTIASLASSPPVVSGMAITAATMAPSSSTSTTSSLSAGTALRSASADDGAPPATCSSAMADDDNNDNNGGARDVASPASSRPSRADDPHLGEVERRVPPREGVVGAVVQGCSLPLLALLRLARRRPRPPSTPPIFPSAGGVWR
jgi:hypothetical protein